MRQFCLFYPTGCDGRRSASLGQGKRKGQALLGDSPACLRSPCGYVRAHDETAGVSSQSRPVALKVCLQEGHRGLEKARVVTNPGSVHFSGPALPHPGELLRPCLHLHAPWTHLFPCPGGQLQIPAPLVKVFCAILPVAWRTLFSFVIVLVLTGKNMGHDAKGLRGMGGMGVREGDLGRGTWGGEAEWSQLAGERSGSKVRSRQGGGTGVSLGRKSRDPTVDFSCSVERRQDHRRRRRQEWMKSSEVRLLWGPRGAGQGPEGSFPCLASDSVVTVTLTPTVRSSRHQCCEDVGRKGVCGGRMGSSR
ncbi:uncharacterized protein LOC122429334 [Cervus canadensis]|uniref:uncharacterized protein LOC122429334 n=1 Tax=Cervus canadensis TaxID=1574408 RepID=UPI001CA3659C|nr:uncharacterized protein LOC122429334 [Cervus canadensis]XP_043305498.1 uncharacterized protein LOC122429334 [Cervus canadensis]